MKNYTKKALSLLTLLIILVASIGLSYANDIDSAKYETLRKEKLIDAEQTVEFSNRSNDDIDSFFTEEELKLIEENYQKRLIQEEKDDMEVGNIVQSYSNAENIYSKAISIEKSDKIECMLEIIDILENKSLKIEISDKEKLISFLERYAPYSDNEILISYLKENTIQQFAMRSDNPLNYYPSSSIAYAYRNYDKAIIQNYPNLDLMGGDCANFVSQCLYIGGIATDKEWYIKKLNDKNPIPSSSEELDASWELADPSPWISATEFNTYWSRRALRTEELDATYVYNNQRTVYNKDFFKGDVVQILKKRLWYYRGYHTMLITSYKDRDFALTYRSRNRKDKTLNSIAEQYNSSDYKFKFFGLN